MDRMSVHRGLYDVYQRLPATLQQIARRSYDTYVSSGILGPSYRREFVSEFFEDRSEFEAFEREFERTDVTAIVEEAKDEHARRTGHGRFAAVNDYTSSRLYALVRKLQPETVVETGVCNGVSTLITLTALAENGHGELHSVDYPDHDRIPEGEDPGWIIPDDRRDRWSLTTGLSQEELPAIVGKLDGIDLFIHDTKAAILDEELDIVWPKLAEGAPTIADDVHQADVFGKIREEYPADAGFVAPNVGYLIKRQ